MHTMITKIEMNKATIEITTVTVIIMMLLPFCTSIELGAA